MSTNEELGHAGEAVQGSGPPPAARLLAWAGILGPTLFTVTFIVLAQSRSDYSHVADPVSALAASGYGLSWQIVPTALGQMLQDEDPKRAERRRFARLARSVTSFGAHRHFLHVEYLARSPREEQGKENQVSNHQDDQQDNDDPQKWSSCRSAFASRCGVAPHVSLPNSD